MKVTSKHFSKVGQKVKLTNGPKRYHCEATTHASGRPTVGACYRGTVAFPKSGFQWLG